MRHTKIAMAKPFEGLPRINLAAVYGASPRKPLLLHIPVTGERPITYGATNLPEGLELKDGIIIGQIEEEGNYTVMLTAENALGKAERELTFEIKEDGVVLTPLMGFTSWNAFGQNTSQEKMLDTAKRMVDLGIAEYGYSYINTDSGWQGQYGGKFDAVMPNEKFPDIKGMVDELHTLGFKCGIYSSPMLYCWPYAEKYPGCTCGEPDIRFYEMNDGIGVDRREKNNAKQWEEWGFDYLKYDWIPTDAYNADLMKQELLKLNRDMGFCVTVSAMIENHLYWEKNCTSYRSNEDAHGTWDNLLLVYSSYPKFSQFVKKGHYFDLDMLDVGTCECSEGQFQFTEDEKLVAYSMRAFLNSPIQISSKLEFIDEFELSMYCNEEVIAINQDAGFKTPVLIVDEQDGDKFIHVYKKELEDGTYAYAFFNFGETKEMVEIALEETVAVRDAWAKEDVGSMDKIVISMEPHTVRIFTTK